MHSVNHSAAFAGNNKRSPRGSNLRSSIGNGLVLETLEEELKFGDADSYKACVQLDLLRACVALRCNCVPFVGAEMKKVFALPEDGQDKHDKHSHAATAATAANSNTNAIKSSQDKSAPTGILNRTKSSLMTKLFTATEKEDAPPPAPAASVVESPGRPLSVARAQSSDVKKKLALIDVLKLSVKLNQVEIFQQNLRDVISIEDQAASTYVSIKTKEIRTTIFAGYALLVHSEQNSVWHPLPGGGAVARIPVHLARVLLTLGNERRKLADALGELTVLRGEHALEEDDPARAPAPPAATAPAPVPASRSLFAQVDPDSGSDSDGGHAAGIEEGKTTARRAYCEALLYRDHLYKQLCVGLLQNYQDLIRRLRTNTFHDTASAAPMLLPHTAHPVVTRRMNRTGAEMFNSVPEGDEDQGSSSEEEQGGVRGAKMPFCLGQAVEEYKYLQVS